MPARTQTYTFKTGKLKQNGELNRENITIKENPRNKTDNISYNPPSASHPQQKVYDMMMTAPRYAKNHQSTEPWMLYDQRVTLKNTTNLKDAVDKEVLQSMRASKPASKRSEAPPDSRRS